MISRTAFACLSLVLSAGVAFAEPRLEVVENPELVIVDANQVAENEWVRTSAAYGYQYSEGEYGFSLFKLLFEAPIPQPRPDDLGKPARSSAKAVKKPAVAAKKAKAEPVKIAERRLTLPLKPIIGIYN